MKPRRPPTTFFSLLPFSLVDTIQICAGYHTTHFVTTSGKVYSMGLNQMGTLGIGTNTNQRFLRAVLFSENSVVVSRIACSFETVHAIDVKNNQIWGWGSNSAGKIGTGFTDFTYTATPRKVDMSQMKQFMQSNEQMVDIQNGLSFSLVLTRRNISSARDDFTSQIFSWGSDSTVLGNEEGVLLTRNSMIPYPIDRKFYALTPQMKISQIATGSSHSIISTIDGLIFSFGRDQFGQLGQTSSSGVPILSPNSVTGFNVSYVYQIAAGEYSTISLNLYETCYGYTMYDDRVCNGRGSCVSQNQCQCNSCFYGDKCEIIKDVCRPKVSIISDDDTISTFRGDGLQLTAHLAANEYTTMYPNYKVIYEWSTLNITQLPKFSQLQGDTNTLYIPKEFLPLPDYDDPESAIYYFSVRVYPQGEPDAYLTRDSRAQVAVFVKPQSLLARIVEGETRSIPLIQFPNYNYTVTLDALDLDGADEGDYECSWTCLQYTTSFSSSICTGNVFHQGLQTSECQLSLNNDLYQLYTPNVIKFELTGTIRGYRTNRESSTVATLSIANGKDRNSPALRFVEVPPKRVSSMEELKLVVNTMQPEGDIRQVFYRWLCTEGYLPLDDTTILSPSSNYWTLSPNLVIRPNKMSPDFYYTFRLQASYTRFDKFTSVTPYAILEHTVTVIGQPTILSFIVTPLSGEAITSLFNFETQAIPLDDDASVLKYSYEFLDTVSGNYYSISDGPSLYSKLSNVALPIGSGPNFMLTLRVRVEQSASNLARYGSLPSIAYKTTTVQVRPPAMFTEDYYTALQISQNMLYQDVLIGMESVVTTQVYAILSVLNYYSDSIAAVTSESVQQEEKTLRIYLLDTLLDIVLAQNATMEPYNELFLGKCLKIFADMNLFPATKNETILDFTSYQRLMQFMSNALLQRDSFSDVLVGEQLFEFYSQLETYFHDLSSKRSLEEIISETVLKQIAQQLGVSWTVLLSALQKRLVYGAADLSIGSSTNKLLMALRMSRNLAGQSFKIGKSTVTLPKKLTYSSGIVTPNSILKIEQAEMTSNPHESTSLIQISSTISFSLYVDTIEVTLNKKASNQYILVDIPLMSEATNGQYVSDLLANATFNSKESTDETKWLLSCKSYDGKAWTSTGCSFYSMSQGNTSVICSCEQTALYGVFLDDVKVGVPQPDTTSPLISLIVIVIISPGMLVAASVAATALYFVDKKIDGADNDDSGDMDEGKSKVAAVGKTVSTFRDYIGRFHPYIGFVLLPRFSPKYKKQKNYTRVQRFLVAFVSMYVIMCVNAIIFGISTSIFFIVGSIVSVVVGVPVSIMCEFLFLHAGKDKDRGRKVLSVPPVYGLGDPDFQEIVPPEEEQSDFIEERLLKYLPSWTQYIVYALIAVIVVVCMVLMIVSSVGILSGQLFKFNILSWVLGSVCGVCLDVFLVRPLWIVVSAMLWSYGSLFLDYMHTKSAKSKASGHSALDWISNETVEGMFDPNTKYDQDDFDYVISNSRKDVSKEEACRALDRCNGNRERAIDILRNRREIASPLKDETGCTIQEAIRALDACDDDIEDSKRYIQLRLIMGAQGTSRSHLSTVYLGSDVPNEMENRVLEALNNDQEESEKVTLSQARFVLKKKNNNLERSIQYLGDVRLVWVAASCAFDEAVEALDSTNDVFEAVEHVCVQKENKRNSELLTKISKYTDRFRKDDAADALDFCDNDVERALVFLMEVSQIMDKKQLSKKEAIRLYVKNDRKLSKIIEVSDTRDLSIDQVNMLLKTKRHRTRSKHEIQQRFKLGDGTESAVEYFVALDLIIAATKVNEATAKESLNEYNKDTERCIREILRRLPNSIPATVAKLYKDVVVLAETSEKKDKNISAADSFSASEVLQVLSNNAFNPDSTLQYLDDIRHIILEANVTRADAIRAYNVKQKDTSKAIAYLKELRAEDVSTIMRITSAKHTEVDKKLKANKYNLNATLIEFLQQKPTKLSTAISDLFDRVMSEVIAGTRSNDYRDVVSSEDVISTILGNSNNVAKAIKYLDDVNQIVQRAQVPRADAVTSYGQNSNDVKKSTITLLDQKNIAVTELSNLLQVDNDTARKALASGRNKLNKAKYIIRRRKPVDLSSNISSIYDEVIDRIEREEKASSDIADHIVFTAKDLVQFIAEHTTTSGTIRCVRDLAKIIRECRVDKHQAYPAYQQFKFDCEDTIKYLLDKRNTDSKELVKVTNVREQYAMETLAKCQYNIDKAIQSIKRMKPNSIPESVVSAFDNVISEFDREEQEIEDYREVLEGREAFTGSELVTLLQQKKNDTQETIAYLRDIRSIVKRTKVSRKDAIDAYTTMDSSVTKTLEHLSNKFTGGLEDQISQKLNCDKNTAKRAVDYIRTMNASISSSFDERAFDESFVLESSISTIHKNELPSESELQKRKIKKIMDETNIAHSYASDILAKCNWNTMDSLSYIRSVAGMASETNADLNLAIKCYENANRNIIQARAAMKQQHEANVQSVMKGTLVQTDRIEIEKALIESKGDVQNAIALMNTAAEKQIDTITSEHSGISRDGAIEAIGFAQNPAILNSSMTVNALTEKLGVSTQVASDLLKKHNNNVEQVIEVELQNRVEQLQKKIQVSECDAMRALQCCKAHNVNDALKLLEVDVHEKQRKQAIDQIIQACQVTETEAEVELDKHNGNVEKTIQSFKDAAAAAIREKEKKVMVDKIAETCNVSAEDASKALDVYGDADKAIYQINLAITAARVDQIVRKCKKYNVQEAEANKALEETKGDVELAIANIKKHIHKQDRQTIKDIASLCDVPMEEVKIEFRNRGRNKEETIQHFKQQQNPEENFAKKPTTRPPLLTPSTPLSTPSDSDLSKNFDTTEEPEPVTTPPPPPKVNQNLLLKGFFAHSMQNVRTDLLAQIRDGAAKNRLTSYQGKKHLRPLNQNQRNTLSAIKEHKYELKQLKNTKHLESKLVAPAMVKRKENPDFNPDTDAPEDKFIYVFDDSADDPKEDVATEVVKLDTKQLHSVGSVLRKREFRNQFKLFCKEHLHITDQNKSVHNILEFWQDVGLKYKTLNDLDKRKNLAKEIVEMYVANDAAKAIPIISMIDKRILFNESAKGEIDVFDKTLKTVEDWLTSNVWKQFIQFQQQLK
jgi:NACalpha-BTF3-like transcription factor